MIKGLTANNKKARIVTYCASGPRATSAANVLKAEGYENAIGGGGYEAEKKTLEKYCKGNQTEMTA